MFPVAIIINIIILTLFSISLCGAYIINIEAGYEDECFHERAPAKVKIGFSYEVIEGGFFDVDVVIKDPNEVILHQEDKSTSGKVTIETNVEGAYNFCFNMKRSSYTPKMIIFNIDRSDVINKASSSESADKTDDETAKLVSMVESLMLSTVSSRHDTRFLTARDRIHRKINEKTNSNLVWWSGVECILLLVVTLGQVWYLRRFFEIRRKA